MSDLLAFMRDRALTPAERRRMQARGTQSKGYAAQPGTGPAGETCGSCGHLVRKQMAKVYRKCGLMRAHWTGGKGTDVLVASPACRNWQAVCDTPPLTTSKDGRAADQDRGGGL